MPLSATTVKNAKPKDKPYKISDERGLYLLIAPQGGKSWKLKYRFHGVEKKLSLGRYPDVGLQLARTRRDEARSLIAQGVDPAREKRAAQIAATMAVRNTFAVVATEFIEKREREGLAHATVAKNRWFLTLLERRMGGWPVAEITASDLFPVLQEVQETGRLETARRLRAFIGRVIKFAVATGRAKTDPTRDLQGGLLAPKTKHHPSIVERGEIGKLLVAIDGYAGYPSTCGALQLTPHLFQRPGEIRMMKWADLDLQARRWTIGEAETKMRRKHDVPLSRQAVRIIESMREVSGRSQFVFPAFHSPRIPMSENTVNQALRKLGYAGIMTAHGFRSTASTLLNESGEWNPDAIERALAHQDKNAVRSAYNRGTYWDERVRMMQWWSDELDRLKVESDVAPEKPPVELAEAPNGPTKGPQLSADTPDFRRTSVTRKGDEKLRKLRL